MYYLILKQALKVQTTTLSVMFLFNPEILKGKRIGVYEHSSAGRDLYAPLFNQMGAEVISLGRSDEFVPIDTEAVSDEDRILAREWSKNIILMLFSQQMAMVIVL